MARCEYPAPNRQCLKDFQNSDLTPTASLIASLPCVLYPSFIRSFFKYLRNVSIEGDLNKPNIEFTADGDLKSAELKIMNLRPSANNKNLVWEEVSA